MCLEYSTCQAVIVDLQCTSFPTWALNIIVRGPAKFVLLFLKADICITVRNRYTPIIRRMNAM